MNIFSNTLEQLQPKGANPQALDRASLSSSTAATLSPSLEKNLAQLKSLGYKIEIDNSTVMNLENASSQDQASVGRVLDKLRIRQFTFMRSLDQAIGGNYALQLSTRAENLPEDQRVVKLQRYTTSWADKSHNTITLTDNFSGQSSVIKINPDPQELAAWSRLNDKPAMLPNLPTIHTAETLGFKTSQNVKPFGIAEGVRSFMRLTAADLSFGSGSDSSASIFMDLNKLGKGRELSSVKGYITEIGFGFDSGPRDLPASETDKYGNVFIYGYHPSASHPNEGAITVEIQLKQPDRTNANGEATLRVDMSLLKDKFSQFAGSPNEIKLKTNQAASSEYLNYKFTSLLPEQQNSKITQKVTDTIVQACNGVHDLFGTRDVISEVRFIDTGALGGNSHVNIHLPGVIHISDNRLEDLTALKNTARHEAIHVLDLKYGLSASKPFIGLLEDISKNAPELLSKITLTGEHPQDNKEELFETLLAKICDFEKVDLSQLTRHEKGFLKQAFVAVYNSINQKVPDAPILERIEGILHSPKLK